MRRNQTPGRAKLQPGQAQSVELNTLFYTNFNRTDVNGSLRSYRPDGDVRGVLIEPIGVNGLAIDERGTLVAADYANQWLVRIDPNTGARSKIPGTGRYMGNPFNATNDVVVRSDGHIYFTDPSFQQGDRPGQAVRGYYHVAPNGDISRIGEQNQPNGIALSPDGNWLYVARNGASPPLRKYQLNADGSVAAGTTIANFKSDGIAVDCAGNLYLTTGRSSDNYLLIVDDSGTELGQLDGFVGGTTHVAVGGVDHKPCSSPQQKHSGEYR